MLNEPRAPQDDLSWPLLQNQEGDVLSVQMTNETSAQGFLTIEWIENEVLQGFLRRWNWWQKCPRDEADLESTRAGIERSAAVRVTVVNKGEG